MGNGKKEREVPSEVKTGNRKRVDHPLLQFSRSMREFRGGIAELKRATDRLGQAKESKSALPQHSIQRQRGSPGFQYQPGKAAPQLVKPVASKQVTVPFKSERHSLPEAGRHIGRRSNIGQELRQFAGATPRIPIIPPSQRPASPLRDSVAWRHVYGPEDKEAVQHLTETTSTGTFEDLPRAARVAMVMKADEIAKNEGRQDRVISFLAAAARSGKPEIAANFNPRRLEKMLGSLLGGQQKAMQALWTPEVSKIVERYQTERKVIQEKLQSLERTIPEGVSREVEIGVREARTAVPAPAAAAAAVAGPHPISTPRSDNRTVEALFKRNDMLHLKMHGANRQQQLVARQGGSMERSVPAAAGGTSHEVALPAEGSTARRTAPAPETSPKGSSGSDRRKLEGTLTLVSGNGETIGSAVLRGNERNG